MAVLKKSSVTTPVLPKEQVPVEALGGEVIVQALTLGDRLDLSVDGVRKLSNLMPVTLSKCVVDRDGEPIFSAQEWDVWGANNIDAVISLFDVVQRLSGVGESPKNEEAPS